MAYEECLEIQIVGFLSTGCAMSGLIADSRTMVDKARVEAQVTVIT